MRASYAGLPLTVDVASSNPGTVDCACSGDILLLPFVFIVVKMNGMTRMSRHAKLEYSTFHWRTPP